MISDFCPPWAQFRKIIGSMSNSPVQLWRDIVNRPILEPCQRIAVNTVILPVTADGSGIYSVFGSHNEA